MKNIVLFGAPAVGKGTQSVLIKDKYNLIHITTGGLFRSIIDNNEEYAAEIASYIDYGNLVPDEITFKVMSNEIKKHKNPKGFIFDGFPRTTNQHNILQNLLNEFSLSNPVIIAINLNEDLIYQRLNKRALTENRIDDSKPEFIAKRLKIYNNESSKVLPLFAKHHIIDGNNTVDKIFNEICHIIDNN